jgi:hypothetical protein
LSKLRIAVQLASSRLLEIVLMIMIGRINPVGSPSTYQKRSQIPQLREQYPLLHGRSRSQFHTVRWGRLRLMRSNTAVLSNLPVVMVPGPAVF